MCIIKTCIIFAYTKTLNNTDMTTQYYEIKKGRNWELVKATSMNAINTYCKDNGYTDWRMKGMMSRQEMISNNSIKVVA